FSIVAFFLLPIPFTVYTYRYHWQAAVLMIIAATILSTLFFTVVAIPMTLLASFGGLMIGIAMKDGATPYETLARGAVGFIAGIVALFLFTQFLLGVDFVGEIDAVLEESLESSQQFVQSVGIEQSAEEIEVVESIVFGLKDLAPVGIVIMAVILSFVSQWATYKLLNRIEQTTFKFPPFRDLTFPIVMVWIYLLAMILMFIDLDPHSTLYLAVQNVYVLVGLLIALQGYSLLFYYNYHKGRSIGIPIIAVIVTLIFPFQFIYIVRMFGIIDIGFSLRERVKKVKK